MFTVDYDTTAGIHRYYVVISFGPHSLRNPCCTVRRPCKGHREALRRAARERAATLAGAAAPS